MEEHVGRMGYKSNYDGGGAQRARGELVNVSMYITYRSEWRLRARYVKHAVLRKDKINFVDLNISQGYSYCRGR